MEAEIASVQLVGHHVRGAREKSLVAISPLSSELVSCIYSSFESFMTTGDSIKGKVQRLYNLFESDKSPSRGADEAQTVVVAHAPSKLKPAKSVDCGYDHGYSFRLPSKEDRIVVYFTSSEDVRGLLCHEDDIKGI
ncbi:hypothetical protein NL676_034060 [Syzygium grande]|nr:hypothetical protein NL676_034060 [Syzygium grande]